MKLKLTMTAVDALPLPAKGYVIYRDSELKGFGVRVTSKGDKSYIVERRVNGPSVRSTLGRHGEVSLVNARALAKQELGRMSAGVNPIAEKRNNKPLDEVITFQRVAFDYIAERSGVQGGIKASTAKDYMRDIDGYLSSIALMPINEIQKPTIADLHKSLSKKGPTAANRAMRVARAVFNFAVDNENYLGRDGEPLIEASPVGVLKKRRLWNTTRRKKTFLDNDALGPWLNAVLTLDASRWSERRVEIVQGWLLLMVCCGFRPCEPPQFRSGDWNPKTREIIVRDPKNINTAQAEEFIFPLGWRMQCVLENLHGKAGDYLLPADTTDTPLSDPRSLTDDVIARSAKFEGNDLRRTFASILSALSPAPSEYQIKRLINHTPDKADVTTGYVQHERETLRGFAQRVEDIVFNSMTSARPLRPSST